MLLNWCWGEESYRDEFALFNQWNSSQRSVIVDKQEVSKISAYLILNLKTCFSLKIVIYRSGFNIKLVGPFSPTIIKYWFFNLPFKRDLSDQLSVSVETSVTTVGCNQRKSFNNIKLSFLWPFYSNERNIFQVFQYISGSLTPVTRLHQLSRPCQHSQINSSLKSGLERFIGWK